MGMFIRVTNANLATHHVQYIIPQHVCGMYGRLPSETYGVALSRLFPAACSIKAGDPLTPAVLRIDGAKFTAGERELIEGLPLRPTLEQFWEHLNAPRKARIEKILTKLQTGLGLSSLLWVQIDDNGDVLLRTTLWYADAVGVTERKLRKLIRKDELKLVMSGGVDYPAVNLRPF